MQLVGYRPYTLQDNKGACPLRSQLTREVRWQLKVISLQPHQIPNSMLFMAPMLVCLLLHRVLCTHKVVSNMLVDASTCSKHVRHSLNLAVL